MRVLILAVLLLLPNIALSATCQQNCLAYEKKCKASCTTAVCQQQCTEQKKRCLNACSGGK